MDDIRPDEITSEELPIALRGYDRHRVERLLARVADGYTHVWRQRDAFRDRLRSLEADIEASEGEARVSASSVAALVQRLAAAEEKLGQVARARDELAARLARAEGERDQALVDVREVTERADELGRCVTALEEALRHRGEAVAEKPPTPSHVPALVDAGSEGEAARLLLAAARAADELRESARDRALSTLSRMRERAASVASETARERSLLAELRERRLDAERAAEEIIVRARVEAERIVAEVGEQRSRVRTLLAGVLADLDSGGPGPSEDLLDDLSARLRENPSEEGVGHQA